jgi:hypothetical protein
MVVANRANDYKHIMALVEIPPRQPMKMLAWYVLCIMDIAVNRYLKDTSNGKVTDLLDEYLEDLRSDLDDPDDSTPSALIVSTAIEALVASGLAAGEASGYIWMHGAETVVATAIDVYALLVAEQIKGRKGRMVMADKLRIKYTWETDPSVLSNREAQHVNHLESALNLLQHGKVVRGFGKGYYTIPFPPRPVTPYKGPMFMDKVQFRRWYSFLRRPAVELAWATKKKRTFNFLATLAKIARDESSL